MNDRLAVIEDTVFDFLSNGYRGARCLQKNGESEAVLRNRSIRIAGKVETAIRKFENEKGESCEKR